MLMLLLMFVLLLVRESHQYGDGAPDSVCTSMNPSHDVFPQSTRSPYSVYVSAGQYSAGGTLTVTVNGTQPFKGFLLMASTREMTGPIGTFATAPDAARLACNGGALTHTSGSPKPSLTTRWTAPPSVRGNLYFYATVVQEKQTYWLSVPSALVWDGVTSTASTTVGTTVKSPTISSLSVKSCDVTKSCISYPGGCVDRDCLYLLTWELLPGLAASDAAVLFSVQTLTSSTIGYVSVGFSKVVSMQAMSVVNCVSTDTGARVTQTYASGNEEPAAITSGTNVFNATASASSGLLQCSFIWNNSAAARQSAQQFDLTSEYYVIVARGPALGNAAGTIMKHSSTPIPTTNRIVVASTRYSYYMPGISPSTWLKKVHGFFMTIAWLLCCTTSVILARYYKKSWLDTKLCGEKIWFAWHRGLALVCAGLTLVAFILVFIAVKDWSSIGSLPYDSHAYLGVIVTALTIANPIMGFLRCNPGTRMRAVFNWAHWFVGNLALVLAGTTLLIGYQLTTSVCPQWIQYVAAAYVVWFGICYFVLMLEQHLSSKAATQSDTNVEMKSGADDETNSAPTSCCSRNYLRRLFLAIHIGLTVAVTAVVSVTILASS